VLKEHGKILKFATTYDFHLSFLMINFIKGKMLASKGLDVPIFEQQMKENMSQGYRIFIFHPSKYIYSIYIERDSCVDFLTFVWYRYLQLPFAIDKYI